MITRDDLAAALTALAERRPVFHSEADFQHELAWLVRERYSDVGVRLERPVPLKGERGEVDIWLRERDGPTAVELKYWTRRLELTERGEIFALRDQSANDQRRYDIWKDVARIERLVDQQQAVSGYVIALTNDHLYWSEGTSDP